ncbi:SDR family oxidoreductase, partial [Mesorhizobium sp. M2D.F.Ca.ET.140.01.1.1]
LPGKHLAKSLDVAVESDVVSMFEELRGRFGYIDVLVNSADTADRIVPAIEQLSKQLEHVLDVNLTGAFTCAREAIKAMRPGGVILNLGSIDSFLPFAPRHAYGASKAGMDMLTRCMAAELGPVGIRTATVAP